MSYVDTLPAHLDPRARPSVMYTCVDPSAMPAAAPRATPSSPSLQQQASPHARQCSNAGSVGGGGAIHARTGTADFLGAGWRVGSPTAATDVAPTSGNNDSSSSNNNDAMRAGAPSSSDGNRAPAEPMMASDAEKPKTAAVGGGGGGVPMSSGEWQHGLCDLCCCCGRPADEGCCPAECCEVVCLPSCHLSRTYMHLYADEDTFFYKDGVEGGDDGAAARRRRLMKERASTRSGREPASEGGARTRPDACLMLFHIVCDFFFCFCFSCLNTFTNRRQLRRRYRMDAGRHGCTDCIAAGCCQCCANYQQLREMQARGDSPGVTARECRWCCWCFYEAPADAARKRRADDNSSALEGQ